MAKVFDGTKDEVALALLMNKEIKSATEHLILTAEEVFDEHLKRNRHISQSNIIFHKYDPRLKEVEESLEELVKSNFKGANNMVKHSFFNDVIEIMCKMTAHNLCDTEQSAGRKQKLYRAYDKLIAPNDPRNRGVSVV